MNTIIEFLGHLWTRLTGLLVRSQGSFSQSKFSFRFGVAVSNVLLLLVIALFSGNTYAATPDSSSTCGGHLQTVCPWPDYFPSCDTGNVDKDLAGTCYNTNPNKDSTCGGNGQSICYSPIFPTCDTNMTQSGSSCVDTNPNNNSNCGGNGQPICQLPIFPTCDTNITQNGSSCVDTNPNNNSNCGGNGQAICYLPIFPTCDSSLVQDGNVCRDTNPNSHTSCGADGQPICQLPIFPTCDTNITQVGSSCVDTNPNNDSSCGGSTQSICQLPISPTCDTNLAQRFSDNTCQVTNPNLTSSCGGIGQSICVLPTFPTCDTNLVQDGNVCRDSNPNSHSSCGGDGQPICQLPIFPTCDTNITQVGNSCVDTNPNNDSSCGGNTQSICQLPIFPTCDTNLAQRLSDNTCQVTNPNLTSSCGGIGQSICVLPTFPTCDTNLVQEGNVCRDSNPNSHSSCGADGQPICELPIFPTCDTGITQEGNLCKNRNPDLHSNCGGDEQAICELPIFPTCDSGLAQRLSDNTCHVTNPNLTSSCGGDTQAICELPIFPTCDSNIVQIGSSCYLPSMCGSAGQRACTILPEDADRRAAIGGRSCEAGTAEVPGLPDESQPAFGSISQCEAVTACGGDGQRACCGGDVKDGFIGACAAGHVEFPGGQFAEDNNLCGGLNLARSESSGMCMAVTACGGDGQRACCSGSGEFAVGGLSCQSGLTESVGCTGDCTCGGFSANIKSNGTCMIGVSEIAEPATNSVPPVTARENSLSGYADLHIHLHGDLAHGKQVLVGQPAPTGSDGKFLLDSTHNINTALSQYTDFDVHGSAHGLIGDVIGDGTGDNAVGNMGVPYFNNWPNWRTSTHQQMYYKWLERAYKGGLRLTVLFAVTNEALCRSTAPDGVDLDARCANSMPAIDEQLTAARDFESFIDGQSGGPGLGWFRIVETPEDARLVIEDGKLAVILGIEVDNIFNCKAKVIREDLDASGNVVSTTETGGCPDAILNGETEEEYITRSVQAYYDLGVRHVFPVHNFDNAFGSPATWQDAINVGNRAVEGAYWQTEECPATARGDYGFNTPADIGNSFISWITGLFGFGLNDSIPLNSNNTSCHVTGLNVGQGDTVQTINNAVGLPLRRITLKHDTLGDFLFNKLMDKGMIIDIDHLSIKSVNNAIGIARNRSPNYPLVASHVQFFDLNQESIRHERMRTREQLEAIRDDGGMIAAMLKDDQVDTDKSGMKFNIPYKWQTGTEVVDDCRHSSKTMAQMYQYAVDVMGGPVAFGSDFNGMAGHVGPRFGSDACGGRIDALSAENAERTKEKAQQMRDGNRLEYPFVLAKPGFDTLSKQVTGKKTFDFNVDGLAHVGLLPDMVKDMEIVGMDDHYIDAIFNSAEQYVRVWERATAISTGAPVVELNLQPAGPPADCVDVELCFLEANPPEPAVTDPQDPGANGQDASESSGGSMNYWMLMLLGLVGLTRVFNVRNRLK